MPDLPTGRCLCGAVTFICDEPLLATRACWCRDCQYLSTGGASMNAFVRKASVTVTGELRAYDNRSDAGNLIRRRFCPTCGTHIFSEAVEEHEFMIVRVGTLDSRQYGKPQSYIWTASAPDWGHIDPDVPASTRQPNP